MRRGLPPDHRLALTGAAFMAAAVLAITACGHDAGSSDQPASSPRSTVDTNFDQIPGQIRSRRQAFPVQP